jgi:nicotinamidase-related amidase
MLAERDRAQLLVIDVQGRLAPHIEGQAEVVANCARLIGYARQLGVPITITEHYPKGLGPTADAVIDAAGNEPPRLETITFSCWKDQAIRARVEGLAAKGRDQVVVAGMETHVCVGQTVLDMLAHDQTIMLVADAVGSRQARTRDIAIDRMRAAGAEIVTQEMIAFEWLERGDAPEIKDVLRILK